ncbi:MAG: chemotaxis protein CheW [Nitrospiraceae bacterium]|nr:chemotaxis protein CheW [Nitrospiraceae bacterium]
MTSNYLLFRLGERLFGVRMQGAVEILPWKKSRRVPSSLSYVEGIMDYRGELYPVFQLAQLLGIPQPGPIGFTASEQAPVRGRSIILLREGSRSFGITVDLVVKMARLEDSVEQPAEIKGINPQLLAGVRMDEDQEVILIHFERLFNAG